VAFLSSLLTKSSHISGSCNQTVPFVFCACIPLPASP